MKEIEEAAAVSEEEGRAHQQYNYLDLVKSAPASPTPQLLTAQLDTADTARSSCPSSPSSTPGSRPP